MKMENKDFSNIGDQVRNAVEDAMNSKNYQELNQKINRTVEQAINEARRQFVKQDDGVPYVKSPQDIARAGQNRQTNKTGQQRTQQRNMQGGKKTGDQRETKYQYSQTSSVPKKMALNVVPKGKVISLPIAVTGITVSVVTGVIAVTGLFTSFITGGYWNFAGMITLLIIAAMFGAIGYVGVHGWNRYQSFKRYLGILRGREYCSIKELSEKADRSEKKVLKDLKELISSGMYVEGYVDQNGTCLTMTNKAYTMLQQAERARMEREKQEREKQEEEKKEKTPLDLLIQKGNEYIEQVRLANDAIPGVGISEKLDRLENVMKRIFESVKEHPEQIKEMDRFMEYYLPTTLKLVNAYKEFDALTIKGENVKTSMEEIENTIDTINHAFEQLLDDLFQDAAFDISSDISVLQTMLAKEGYKEKDFK